MRIWALTIALLLLASTALAAPPPGRGGPPDGAGPPADRGPDRDTPISPVEVSVDDASATEGSPVDFTVSLDQPATVEVTVAYETNDIDAVAGTHYTATAGQLVIPAGNTAATVSVPTVGDTVDNPDRTFTLDLTAVSNNASLTDAQGVGTILDDDDAGGTPMLSVGDVTVTEGGAADFVVSLSGAATQNVTFDFATADGTAVATVASPAVDAPDYQETSGAATIPAGDTSTIVTVQTLDDLALDDDGMDEPDETFTLTVSNVVGADVADATGEGTILDNDAPPVLRLLSRNVAEDDRSGGVSATIDLEGRSSQDITLDFTSFSGDDDTATEGVDYTPVSTTTITIGAGFTTGTAGPTPLNDDEEMWEGDETFTVVISNVSANASIDPGADTATITIKDDDGVTGCDQIQDGHEDGNDTIGDMPGPIEERQPFDPQLPDEYHPGLTSQACQGDHDWWRLGVGTTTGDEFNITILGEHLDLLDITAEFHPIGGTPQTLTAVQIASDPGSTDPGAVGGWSVEYTSDGTAGDIFVDVLLPGTDPDLGVSYEIGYLPFLGEPHLEE